MHSGLDGGEMHLRPAHQLQPAAERKSLSIPRFLQYYAEIMHAKKGLLMVTKETRTARASTALHFAHKSPLRKKDRSRPQTGGSPVSLTPVEAAVCFHPRRCRGSVAPGSQKATEHSPPLELPSLPLALR